MNAVTEVSAPPTAEAPPETGLAEVDEEIPEPPEGEFGEAPIDDLSKIEGIGSTISSLLWENGVRTYEQLAKMSPVAIKTILEEAGIEVPDPETWPRQAELAAQGHWEDLETFQQGLKGDTEVDDDEPSS
jgi:predicted flap endonuclease-1-like 5' DNA nuclease